MRCEKCLQIMGKCIRIIVFQDPMGNLQITCPHCGHSESYLISEIPKEKAICFEGKSFWEK